MPEALAARLRRILGLEPGEGRPLAWAVLFFFLVLSSLFVIRPLRDEMGARGGDDTLTWLFVGTLAGTLAANVGFGALVARFPRRVFVPFVYHAVAACLVGFFALLHLLEGEQLKAVGKVFFVWASVLNLFAVSVFWGLMADLHRSGAGKRLFGIVAVGGTLGALTGSTLTAFLAGQLKALGIETAVLLLLAALLLEGAVLAMGRLVRAIPDGGAAVAAHHAPPPPQASTLDGLKRVLASPYLATIAGFVLLYTITSTFLYFEQARIARTVFSDSAARVAFFAQVDLATNGVTLLAQLFASGRILGLIGIGPCLAAMPVISLGGLALLEIAPSAAALVLVQALRRGAEHTLVRPAREVLYTVVGREEKYASKSVIDTFVYRSGDVVGAWGDRALQAAAFGPAGLLMLALPLAALWIGSSLWLGRRQESLAGGGR